ncbi:MBL fold metallo-hydrolase [Pseudotenacibaculum sp. MALMAid0570]|uniref:MBL fold metallo-hydrolase n=1 Tax=Pseudotenacibaculum sp. MALMAid0570 TaxID=3143938 RepID=UPI0032DE41FE
MKTLKFLITLVFISLNISVSSQNREVKIEVTKITEQFYMLKGQGGNIGLFIGEDAIFMIDDQFAPLTPKILEAIKKITPQKVDYLINTHWHGDHTGGNENMAKEGALIVAHENVRKRMSKESTRRGRKIPASPKEALPVITFDKDVTFHINGDDILATHIHNAHTDGDALVYFANNNVLHTGDSYFQTGFPYIDLTSGGSIDGYISGIEKMIMLVDDETKIVPGHGTVSSKKDLEEYLVMLRTLKNRVEAEIKKGKTLEEVKKNTNITKGYESKSWWITSERIRETIFRSLNKQ